MFSQYIQIFLNQIQFLLQILKRFCKVLFRKNRNLEFVYLDYSNRHLFNNSIIIVNYRFRNAICYKFGNQFTIENQVKLLVINLGQPEIKLTVYGFFTRQNYSLKLDPENILISSTFKTKFRKLNPKLETIVVPKNFTNEVNSESPEIKIKIPDVALTTKPIITKHNSFNQSDFI